MKGKVLLVLLVEDNARDARFLRDAFVRKPVDNANFWRPKTLRGPVELEKPAYLTKRARGFLL
jgi:hypothetical protein